jgi:hypothetical protein
MWNLEDRGPMMIEVGIKVYEGMIIGEHTRGNDLEVNVLKGKKLTNVRASGTDEAVRLTTPIRMTLEKALAYIQDDELVEVTPENIRLRKVYLDPNERKRTRSRPACSCAASSAIHSNCASSMSRWRSFWSRRFIRSCSDRPRTNPPAFPKPTSSLPWRARSIRRSARARAPVRAGLRSSPTCRVRDPCSVRRSGRCARRRFREGRCSV